MTVKYIKECASSNTYAANEIEKGLAEDLTFYIVENQTDGRGQGNNIWYSEEGKNLTFSVVLKPTFLKPDELFYLSKVISIAITDYVGLFCSDYSIKWPNDIYIKNKKVAGILIENIWYGNNLKAVISGVGLNINQQKFPEQLLNATSLIMNTGIPFKLKESFNFVSNLIITRYNLLKDDKFQQIDDDYCKLLYKKNIVSNFKINDFNYQAKIIDVEKSGKLVLQFNDNTVKSFAMHEIKML